MPSRKSRSNGGRGRGINGRYPNGKQRRRVRRKGDTNNGTSAFPAVSESKQEVGMSIRSMPLFGLRTRRVVQYSNAFFGVTSGASTAGSYIFSANGLYDPNITGTGSQPMGFDQMMLFYNHYTVTRSRIRVLCSATSAGGPQVALAVTGNPTALTSPEQILEGGRCSTLWLNAVNVEGCKGTLQASVNLGKYQGLKNVMDDPDMRGDISANPTEQVYFIIYCWYPVDSTVVAVAAQVLIEYDTIFSEYKTGPLS